MTWQRIPLGELSVERGGSVDPSKFPDETFELFSIPAFDKGEAEIIAGKEIGSSKKCVQPNDVLISRIVPHIRRSWVVPQNYGYRQIASGEWIQFRSDQIYPNYLRHFLVSDPFHLKFMKTVSGVGGSLLRARPKEVYRIKIPLPPLEEQKRIARILDTADEIRTKRRQSIEELDRLAQSVFLDMFGDSVTNPKGWETTTIKKVSSKVGSGATPTGGNDSYKESGISLIRSLNVYDGVFKKKGLAFIDDAQAKKLNNVIVEPNDVLLNITGASVARVCRVPSDILPARVNQHVSIIRTTEKMNAYYLEYLLMSGPMKTNLLKIGETGATRQAITKSQILSLEIPLPSVNLQKKFASIIQAIEDQKSLHQQHLTELDNLFASLQSRAFNGTL